MVEVGVAENEHRTNVAENTPERRPICMPSPQCFIVTLAEAEGFLPMMSMLNIRARQSQRGSEEGGGRRQRRWFVAAAILLPFARARAVTTSKVVLRSTASITLLM